VTATQILRRERLSVAAGLAVLVAIALSLGSCGGSGTGSSSESTVSTTAEPTAVDPLAPSRFADPTQPVSVNLSGRFELLLPADPTRGWRWVLEPVDTAVVVPLSSEFLEDPVLLSSTSSTTTSTNSSTNTNASEPTVTWVPTTTTTIDPDSPEVAPMVQVISFAARSIATTEIRLRYERISGSDRDPRTTTFTVVVHAVTS
jgi:hypothetical protein